MAQIPYACNLTAAAFPFRSSEANLTTIVRQLDDIYNRVNDSSQVLIPDQSIPQCIFLENVMPSGRGYQAISHMAYADFIPGTTDFTKSDRVYNFRAVSSVTSSKPPGPDIVDIKEYPVTLRFIYDDTGGGTISVYRLIPNVFVGLPYRWNLVQTLVNLSALPTMASVAGGTVFMFNNATVSYVWNALGEFLAPITLTGLSSSFTGCTSANGYLIAWNGITLAWSSISDPTDFVPSLITGAGGGAIQDCDGLIQFALPINGGFILYCTNNVVTATFTNNLRFPFSFKALSGSGGCTDIVQVGYNPSGNEHYMFGTFGLQVITLRECKNLYAELNDFLSGRTIEEYSVDDHWPREVSYTVGLRKRIRIISGRYVVFSYGTSDSLECTQAIILDLTLGRFGKIKIDHLDAFDFLYSSVNESEDNRISIATTLRDGTVRVVDFRPGEFTRGVVILGRYQLSRGEYSQLTEVNMQNVISGAPITVFDAVSLDGEAIQSINVIYQDTKLNRLYHGLSDVIGYNHQLIFEGGFNMNSLEIYLNSVGRL